MNRLLYIKITFIIAAISPLYIQPAQRKDFFKEIVGMDEQTFRNTFKWDASLTLKDPQTGKILDGGDWPTIVLPWVQQHPSRWAIFQGYFDVKTLSELMSFSAPQPFQSTPSFNILFFDPNQPEQTDIRFLQANPVNKNAAFQIASNFFGPLEGGMANPQALLTDMIKQAVQGEEASISAAGATIFRKYFMPQFDSDANGNYYYLLSDLVTSGIINSGPLNLNSVKNYKYNPQDREKIKIGIHKNVVVTSGYGNGGKGYNDQLQVLPISFLPNGAIDEQKTQVISQIFTAAVNLSSTKNLTQGQRNFAQLVLNAAYEGTIALAYINQIPKLYLTLMGGGAFRNSIDSIGKAITSDEVKRVIEFANLNVTLIFYPDRFGRQNPVRNAADDEIFLNNVMQFADSINKTQRAQDPAIQKAINEYLTPFYDGTDITKSPNARNYASKRAQILNGTIAPTPTTPTAPSPLQQALQTLAQNLTNLSNAISQPSPQPQFKFTLYQVYNGDNIGWLEIPALKDAVLVNIENAQQFVLDPNKGVPAISPDYPQQPANLNPIYPEEPAVPEGLYFWYSQNANPKLAQDQDYPLRNRPRFRDFKPQTVLGSVFYFDKFKNTWDVNRPGTKLTPWD